MPRIRSIKPEFATDGDMLKLSDSCALFFVLLWTHCDDEGKHKLDYQQISAELGGRWHQGKIKLFISCLIKSGQLRLNSDSTWVQVTGWSHQKIDKPKQPKVKAEDLQWLSETDSTNALERSRGIDARIKDQGSDRRGSDQGEGPQNPKSEETFERSDNLPEPIPLRKKPAASPQDSSSLLVKKYCEVFKDRYGFNPIVSEKVAGQLKTLMKDLGLARAEEFIEAYLQMNDVWFVTKRHDIATLAVNLNVVAHFIEKGTTYTRKQLQHMDSSNHTQNLIAMVRRGEI